MAEIKYRQRTDNELEDMRQDLIKKQNIVAPCILSNEVASCDPYCSRFYNCWRDDYSSKLENKI